MKNPVKRVAAIHDISGFGRVSLTAVIPILSTMGVQVCPLPTAVLSTHSQYDNFEFLDLSEQMKSFIGHWQRLNLEFDAIYSGYLGSPQQVEIVKHIIKIFHKEQQLVVVDPVLGDNGKLYTSFDQTMVNEMKSLIGYADIITPNITEAAFLLGQKLHDNITIEEVKEWIQALSQNGPRIIIITSVPETSTCKRTAVVAYDRKSGRYWKVSCNYLPANYPGTGDSFASVIVGALLQGDSLPIALDRAVHFTSLGVRATFGYNYDSREGILLERILHNLNAPVQLGSYELLD